MAIAKKEIVYWALCLLYGAVLTGVLLYIRFPAEKFHRYCERIIEEKIPVISCSIAKIKYKFPLQIIFEDFQLKNKEGEKKLIYEDPQLSFQPTWDNPIQIFDIESSAYGGKHRGKLQLNEKTLSFSDVEIKGVNLEQISFFQEKLDRKVSGFLDLSGTAKIKTDKLRLVAAQGVASVNEGEFALKKPVLGLNTLELKESSVNFNLQKDKIELLKGKVTNSQLDASFDGNIGIATPWLSSSMSVKGGIVPHTPLFQRQKQLKAIVSRMQKKYNAQSLPYHVDGTIIRPTFVFGK